jgi:hypothetical protein
MFIRNLLTRLAPTPRACAGAAAVLAATLGLVGAPALAQNTPQAKKPAAKPVAQTKAAPAAAPVAVVDTPLSANEMAVAGNVHVGLLPCELGKAVRMERDESAPGYFHLQLDQQRFRLRPVESRTGAVRLEDPHQGAVWIQLANKSMLMSQKLGRRLVDECAGQAQQQVAAALKLNPAPSLLDPLPVAVAPAPAAVSVAVAPSPAAVAPGAPIPAPAVVATDCRRPLNTTLSSPGVEPC